MGLMECPVGQGRLITTPHPIITDGQQNVALELIPGETLQRFLERSVPDWTDDAWEVRINGVLMPYEIMHRVRPKPGTVIEVRGVARKQALYIVAMVALTYFTFGLGSAAAGAWGAGAAAGAFSGIAGAVFASAVFMAGSILINKVLGPKPASVSQAEQNTVYSIGEGRNQRRPYQPLPLTFGRVKFAPDVISKPYTFFEGDTQYMAMVLTPGFGVHSVEPMTNGDAPLSGFQGVTVYHAGFPGMPDEKIPLYSDADTIVGGELNKDQTWVQRTTPARTVRIQNNFEYILGDADSKSRPVVNREVVEVQYRVTGAGGNWMPLVSRQFANSSFDPKRSTLTRDVPEGQYDVRVRILGTAVDGGGSNGRAQFQWQTMTAVQADTATYAGIPRIGVLMQATGQLQGAPDELRMVAHSLPIPVWKGSEWVTEETGNPGAQILKYVRGFFDENGVRVAGMGLPDSMIDIASLQAFMLHCAANGFEYNSVVKDPRSHDEMLNALAMAGFGQISWARGRLSVIWAADDQPLSGVVNMATIKKGEFQVDYALANAADGIEYTYYDAADWKTKTIRVPAPGVTTMLNPVSVTGEGVTNEQHAALMARWHLAQSLYQYKDISFATDIEHLSYQRLSLLSLSHDLTQWGYSGQVRAAEVVGNAVTLTLDAVVPPAPTGGAYIGVRIPGERTYRVLPANTNRRNRLMRSDDLLGPSGALQSPWGGGGNGVNWRITRVGEAWQHEQLVQALGGLAQAVDIAPGEVSTYSVEAKMLQSAAKRIAMEVTVNNVNGRVEWNPVTGTVNINASLQAFFSNAKVEQLADGWQRFSVTMTGQPAANRWRTLYFNQYGNSAVGDKWLFRKMQVTTGPAYDPEFIATGTTAASQYGPSNKVVLNSAWPSDAPLPGSRSANPAHDTIWCYDFKATPGYRVRVVAIEPETDLKGAKVAVVPESAEFWNYVKTGTYIPAPNESLLQTRPVASNLVVSERPVVQGDTVFTELVAAFDISGPVGDVIVLISNENGELEEVARTTTRTAAWRIPRAGTYQIVVRPFSPEGRVGVATGTIYSTIGADAPPVLVDLFDVVERTGGVRLYTWGWLAGTTQSADFAGVEIRYIAGSVPAPNWDAMTPVGNADGYHTAPFEAVIPESGQWTFAARSRNTSGTLSTGMRTVMKTLGANLGEQIDAIGDRISEETVERISENARIAAEAAAFAIEQANAARDAAIARVDALAAEVAEIVNAPEWSPTESYLVGWLVRFNGRLYRAEQATTGQQPDQFPAVWENLGEYSSVAEIAAAALQMSQTNATSIEAEAQRLDSLYARMPGGNGQLATALQIDQANARVSDVEGTLSAQASQISGISTTLGQVDQKATNAQTAATNAAQAAGNKGKVIFQSAAPAVADRLAQNLWIDTTATGSPAAPGNIPKRWNGTAWVVVTDKAATDAKTAADAAKASAEAIASALTQTNANVSAVDGRVTTQAGRIDTVLTRLPDNNGKAASEASVSQANQARLDGDSALAQSLNVVDAKAGGAQSTATQALEATGNQAALIQNVQAQQNRDAFSAAVTWDFRGTFAGFGFINAAAALFPVTADVGMGVDNQFDPRYVSPLIAIAGQVNTVVRAFIRRRVRASPFDGRLFWATDNHGIDGNYSAGCKPVLDNGDWQIVEWDLSTSDDWRNSTIRRLWFDFESQANTTTDVRWISVGTTTTGGNAGGAGTTSVTMSLQAGLNAKAGLYLDVNGRISGYEATNTGVVSDFNVLADTFRITSPSGGARLEFSNGNLRVYNAAGVLIGRWGSW